MPCATPIGGLLLGTTPRTVPGLLAARALQQPDRVAIDTTNGATMTFAEWHTRSGRVAAGLIGRGVRRGDRVVLRFGGPDWVSYAVAFCGVLRAGAVAVPCSDQLTPAEMAEVLGHSTPVAILTGSSDPASTSWAVPYLGATIKREDGRGVWSATVEALEARGNEFESIDLSDPDGLAQILYTSGTTGRPKGVEAVHANLTATANDPRRRPFGHSEHFLHAYPIGANSAQAMLLLALDARPTALCPPDFNAERFAQLVQSYRVGTMFVVPAMAIELIDSGALDRHDLSTLRLLGSSAAPLPPWVAGELCRRLPATAVVNYYTSTEAAPAEVSMIVDPSRPGSVGRPTRNAVAIRGEDDRDLPNGTVGDVWLQTPVSRSYFRDEDASRYTFRAGWVRMGDVGYLDEDGYLYLVDREQDVVRSGADQVSTIEVEAALFEHPDIADAAVVRMPHPILGWTLRAAVVARDPTRELDRPGLRAFLLQRLDHNEIPAEVIVLDRLPRNAAGKVRKNELRECAP
jgi:acyl-CoA synthetase (AMP-forming)/AMP-acid ligase II